jgi:outer membrane protein assembly factor BamB
MADYRTLDEPLQPDRSILIVGLAGRVYGIDRATGELRWTNVLGEQSLGYVTIAVAYGVVVASPETPGIYCIEYLTGALRWQQRTQASGRATLLVEPEQIVCAKSGYIDAYAPDGRVVWHQPMRGAGQASTSLGYPGNVAQADAGR